MKFTLLKLQPPKKVRENQVGRGLGCYNSPLNLSLVNTVSSCHSNSGPAVADYLVGKKPKTYLIQTLIIRLYYGMSL